MKTQNTIKSLLSGHAIFVLLFFAIVLLAGIAAFQGYGISWDEKTQYIIGRETYEAVFSGAEISQNAGRRFHGPVFEFVLYALQQTLPLKHAQQVFYMRHFVGFLVFYIGIIFFYALTTYHFKSWKMGLLGALMLVLSPRIFAHSFFNTRDVPTLALFIVSMYTLVRLLDEKTAKRAFIHAIVCSLLISLRMTGLLLPALTVLFIGIDAAVKRKNLIRSLSLTAFYCATLVLSTISIWPLLWENPVQNFLAAYENMSTKAAGGFYMGELINSNPWHWIPVWMVITIPLLYSLLFLTGLGSYAHSCLRHPLHFFSRKRNDLLFLLWLSIPIASIVILKASIFDTWRHMFFIYPAFLLIALGGVKWIYQEGLPAIAKRDLCGFIQNATRVCLTASFVLTSIWMIRNHPMQYVYFSLPSEYVGDKFELDYWGLGYRQGFDYIFNNDDSPVIPVMVTSSPGISTFNMLSPEQRKRIRIVGDPKIAKYVLDNFRWKQYEKVFPAQNKIHSVMVSGMEVLNVYQNYAWNSTYANGLPELPSTGMFFAFGKDFMDPQNADGAIISGNQMWAYFDVEPQQPTYAVARER